MAQQKYEVPFPYLTGLDVATRRDLEENFRYVLGVIAAIPPATSIFDAYVDPVLTTSTPSAHVYKNFTDLLANEVPPGEADGRAFNVGCIARGSAFTLTEPGNVLFPSTWPTMNIVGIGGVSGSTTNLGTPEFWWNMPTVQSTKSIVMKGVHVPSQSVHQCFSGLGANNAQLILEDCFFGSGNIITDGDLFAFNSNLNVQARLTSGGSTPNIELWNCYWNGTVTSVSWNVKMFGGYLNGGLVTAGTGVTYINCQIQGTVQIGNTGGANVNNSSFFNQNGWAEVTSASINNVEIRGTWNQLILRGSGHHANVKIIQEGVNPAISLISATHCNVSATLISAVAGAQAYNIDANSHNNFLRLGGSHSSNYTVASVNSGGPTNRIMTELDDTLIPSQLSAAQMPGPPAIMLEDVQDLIDQQGTLPGNSGPAGLTGPQGPAGLQAPFAFEIDLEGWQQEHSEWTPPPTTPVVPTGTEVGYAQITAPVTITSTSEAAPTIIVTAPTITFDGVQAYWFEFYCPEMDSTGSTNWGAAELYEGAGPTDYSTLALASSPLNVVYAKVKVVPPAGARTFKIGGYKNAAGNVVTVQAGTGAAATYSPAFIRITKA